MNATIVLAFVFMLVIVAAMAVGVVFGRKPISGSCGGMKALGMDVECEICGGNPTLCDSSVDTPAAGKPPSERAQGLSYDASHKR